MKQCFCFKTENLLKMVPNFKITLIPALHETEDDAHKKANITLQIVMILQIFVITIACGHQQPFILVMVLNRVCMQTM